mgnify:CR=1 FL=1
MFNDYLRPRRVLPSTRNLRAFDPNGHQHFKASGCFDFDSFDSLVRSSAEKTVCACRRRMFSVSGSFPGDTSSELYLFRDCKICQINISQYMPFSSLEISSLQAPISSNFEHLSLCVDSFWLPAKVWILAEKLARMSLAPISSRISSKNRQTF